MSQPTEPAHEAAQTPEPRNGSDTSDDSTLTDSTQNSSDDSKSSATLTDTAPPSEQYTRANLSYSANPPRRGRRGNGRPSATRRLGAIDEQSNAVHPDVPLRNPRRLMPGVKFFNLGSSQNSSHSSNYLPDYNNVTGPKGEKFSDLRANKAGTGQRRRGGKKKWLWLALAVLLILGIALGVGLGVGLTRGKSNSSSPSSPSSTSSPQSSPAPFPVGKWTISASLLTINTSCTSNTAAFNCYPYTTHAQSASGSTTSLLWDITSPNNSTASLYISSSNPTLSYPFQNTPLTLVDTSDLLTESYTFSSTFTKSVIPQTSITTNGENAICYFNGTILTARLYATAAGAGGIGNATGSAGASLGGTDMNPSVEQPWPYAVEYSESVTNSPECYEYVNGTVGSRIELSGSASGQCGCQYQNYGL